MRFDDNGSDDESLVRDLLRDVGDVPDGFWRHVMGVISDPLTALVNPALVPEALVSWGDDVLDGFDWGPDGDTDTADDDIGHHHFDNDYADDPAHPDDVDFDDF